MTRKQFQALAQRIAPALPQFTACSDNLVWMPTGVVAKGVTFLSSGYSKEKFYVSTFVVPLWVPIDDIYFSFGVLELYNTRGDPWSSDLDNLEADLIFAIEEKAVPILRDFETTWDFIHTVEACIRKREVEGSVIDNNHQEMYAYGLIEMGEYALGLEALNKLLTMEPYNGDYGRLQVERAQLLKGKLERDPLEAKAQLEEWKAFSIRALKLEPLYGLEKIKK
jgi:hypothetical protein